LPSTPSRTGWELVTASIVVRGSDAAAVCAGAEANAEAAIANDKTRNRWQDTGITGLFHKNDFVLRQLHINPSGAISGALIPLRRA
jgi:hypothetical protein